MRGYQSEAYPRLHTPCGVCQVQMHLKINVTQAQAQNGHHRYFRRGLDEHDFYREASDEAGRIFFLKGFGSPTVSLFAFTKSRAIFGSELRFPSTAL